VLRLYRYIRFGYYLLGGRRDLERFAHPGLLTVAGTVPENLDSVHWCGGARLVRYACQTSSADEIAVERRSVVACAGRPFKSEVFRG
jgi:hypothetical protein